MKRLLSTTMLALMSAACMFAQKPFKMEGKIEGEKINTKYYIQVGCEGGYGVYEQEEEIEVKNGKFKYSTQISSIVPAWLKKESGDNVPHMTIYLVPDEKLKLTVKDDEYFYDGTKVYKEMNDADIFVTAITKDLKSFNETAYAELMNTTEDRKETVRDSLTKIIIQKSNARRMSIKEYRKQHLDSEGALIYLSDYDDVEEMYSDLWLKDKNRDDSDFLKKNRVGAYLHSRIDYIIAMRKFRQEQDSIEQAKLDAMNNAPAPDFTLNDINGNPLTLSSLQGKYVILDFWGSWCSWCIKGIPDMKKYYEKYAGKFEILGIDCGDSEQAWKNAVKKHGIPWLHVYNPDSSTLTKDYNITGFPTKIIIDPKGNINKVIVGEDPAFYDYLDELFGK